jgi:PBP1b-binding outer membrane lipoprotein LpoB
MKKIILLLAITTTLFSCKEETNEKVKDATKAITTDVKQSLDTVKEKAKNAIDSSRIKQKAKSLIIKGAEKLEEGAKKVKEEASKNK